MQTDIGMGNLNCFSGNGDSEAFSSNQNRYELGLLGAGKSDSAAQ